MEYFKQLDALSTNEESAVVQHKPSPPTKQTRQTIFPDGTNEINEMNEIDQTDLLP